MGQWEVLTDNQRQIFSLTGLCCRNNTGQFKENVLNVSDKATEQGRSYSMHRDNSTDVPATVVPSPTKRSSGKRDIPYDELDANIMSLVRALNRYPGVITVGSCGGHKVVTNSSQWAAGRWYVKFDISADKLGWYVLEHLAWVINEEYIGAGKDVSFLPIAAPPYLNTPGRCLHFVIEGHHGENPDELAELLEQTRKYLTKKRR